MSLGLPGEGEGWTQASLGRRRGQGLDAGPLQAREGEGWTQARRRRDLSQWHERILERGGRGLGPPRHEAANLVSGTEDILFEILQ